MGIKSKRRKLWKVWCLAGLMICLALYPQGELRVQAASVTFRMEAGETEIQVGDTAVVMLTLESTEKMGGFEAYLSYDPDLLEFRFSEDPISGGEGFLRVGDMEPVSVGTVRTYTMHFEAIGAGEAEILVEEPALVYPENGGDAMEVEGEPLTIIVEPAKEASNVNRLSGLKVSPGQLQPAFDPEVYAYNLEVGAEISSLVISAVPEDVVATVAVTGNKEFTEGTNLVEITVKAENGEARIYRITVQKNPQEVPQTGSGELPEDPMPELGFDLESSSGGFVFRGVYEYLVTAAPTTALSQLPEGYEPYTLELGGEKIPAFREKGGDGGEIPRRVLLYVSAEGESGGFYEFDTQEQTMTRVQIREKQVEIVQNAESSNWLLYGIIAALAVFCAFLGMGLILLIRGRR